MAFASNKTYQASGIYLEVSLTAQGLPAQGIGCLFHFPLWVSGDVPLRRMSSGVPPGSQGVFVCLRSGSVWKTERGPVGSLWAVVAYRWRRGAGQSLKGPRRPGKRRCVV